MTYRFATNPTPHSFRGRPGQAFILHATCDNGLSRAGVPLARWRVG